MFASWLRNVVRSPRHARRPSRPARLQFESLEARWVPVVLPPASIEIPVQAVEVADDNGMRPAGITQGEVEAWIARTNQVYAAANIHFVLDTQAGIPRVSNTNLNNTMWPPTQQVIDAGNEIAARYPGRLTVLFRFGPGSVATGQGFAGSWNFVTMPDLNPGACGVLPLNLLGHEIGHFLGLAHTFIPDPPQFNVRQDAQTFFLLNGPNPAIFDQDGLDTPPDPFIQFEQCNPPASFKLNDLSGNLVTFTPPINNIMSYWVPGGNEGVAFAQTLTPQQADRVRQRARERMLGWSAVAEGARDEFASATASQRTFGGRTVVAWTLEMSSADRNILASIYRSDGTAIASAIPVAASTRMETEPTVAVDDLGRSVICWTDAVSASNRNIVCRRMSASGVLSSPFNAANTPLREYDASMAMQGNGAFVVTWTEDASLTNKNVRGKRFSATATTGSAFSVATVSTLGEHRSSVARTRDGRFVIAYQVDSANGNSDIALRRYSSSGSSIGTHGIAGTAKAEMNPHVAIDDDGNAIIAYELQFGPGDRDIYARKISKSGVLGSVLAIETSTADEVAPAVALDLTPGDGDFVVAFERAGDVFIYEMDALGVRRSARWASRSATQPNMRASQPALAINGSDFYFVTFTRTILSTLPTYDVFAVRGMIPLTAF
jgi:hypothetical protein